MKFLYIGQCEPGSTSRMRYEILNEIVEEIEMINISEQISGTTKLNRSIGWRFHIGPLIRKINKVILKTLHGNQDKFDVIWIDKGVFIYPKILMKLKSRTKFLLHYTPDPAFFYHRSRFFNRSLHIYDFFVTTKSFEIDHYKRTNKTVLFCTQGYDENIHKPHFSFNEKKYDVCFVGHHEIQREKIIQSILSLGLSVALAGIKWEKFFIKNKNRNNLHYHGTNVGGEQYAKLISASKIGLGLLSKWIPEKHTTRTFEIPACGTALLTERNNEIESFYNESEVIFFEDEKDIIKLILKYLNDLESLKLITINGYKRVVDGGYSYSEILSSILNQISSS